MEIWLGFLFLFLGAACGGSFGLPSKFVRKDTPWEVLWGPFFFFVTILLPVVVGPAVVEDFWEIYAKVWSNTNPVKVFGSIEIGVGNAAIPVLVFGFLWGLGSMTLGLSFAFIGLSLAYALNYGAQIVTGSLLPMGLFNPHDMATSHGAVVLAGVGVCVVGVIVAARAAMLKESSLKTQAAPQDAASAKKPPRMLIGLLIGIASGILCACYGVALAFAGPVADAAKTAGNAGVAVAWAQTCLILWGGVLSACGYCVYKLTKNRTWGHLLRPGIGRTLCLAFVMALLHDAAIFFLGLGFPRLNEAGLGVPVGYPAFMAFAIIIGNLHGFRTGEWKGASKKSVQWIVAAIVVLILGVVVLAQGNAMAEAAKKKAAAEAAAQPAPKAKELK